MMKINKKWQVIGDTFFLRDRSVDKADLKKGIYTIEADPNTGELYLKRIEESFEFPFKVYALETTFVDRIMKSYENTKGNFGILANGIKGTGKTVTMKEVANRTNLPIILIHKAYGGINTFISEIQQDLVVFVDEYEKVYSDGNMYDDEDEQSAITGNGALLSLMDGTYTTNFRRMFLLTTNKLWINENMLNRPGRIRYRKNFSDLTEPQIMEIVNDLLLKERITYKEKIVDYLKICQIITVDIVKSVVSEVNIHDEDPFVCCKDFNIDFKTEEFNIVRLPSTEKGKEVIMEENVSIAIVSNFEQRVKANVKQGRLEAGSAYLRSVKAPENGVYTVVDDYSSTPTKEFKIRFEKQRRTHYAFAF